MMKECAREDDLAGTLTDDCLMRDIAAGSPSAFDALQRRHRAWVRSLLHAFVQDEDQAEDLAQEVFCRILCRAGDYIPHGKCVSWIKAIAVNLARNHLRRRRRIPFVSLDEVMILPALGRGGDPAAAAVSMARLEEILTAIRALPEEQCLTIVMRCFEERSLREIADTMECPVGTVKYRLSAGLRRVRQALEVPATMRDEPPERSSP